MQYFNYSNVASLSAHWKLIFSFAGAFLSSLAIALPGGITPDEWSTIIMTSLAASGFVYISPPNNTSPVDENDGE